MQDVTLGPFLIVSGLLVVTGAFKVVSPGGVTGAVSTLGIHRLPRWTGRALGVGEMALGIAAVVVASRLMAMAIAATYLGLTVVVVALRRRGAESCGCFGAVTSPPSGVHLAFDLVAVAVAAGHTVAGGNPPFAEIGMGSPGGWPLVAALAAVGIAAAVGVLTVLPAALSEGAATRRGLQERHDQTHGHDTQLHLERPAT